MLAPGTPSFLHERVEGQRRQLAFAAGLRPFDQRGVRVGRRLRARGAAQQQQGDDHSRR